MTSRERSLYRVRREEFNPQAPRWRQLVNGDRPWSVDRVPEDPYGRPTPGRPWVQIGAYPTETAARQAAEELTIESNLGLRRLSA